MTFQRASQRHIKGMLKNSNKISNGSLDEAMQDLEEALMIRIPCLNGGRLWKNICKDKDAKPRVWESAIPLKGLQKLCCFLEEMESSWKNRVKKIHLKESYEEVDKAAEALSLAWCLRMTVITPLLERIKEAQVEGLKEERQKCERIVGRVASFDYDSRGLLTLHGRVWVPYWGGVRKVLMDEAHKSRFSIHRGATKMYRDLRPDYWWPCMKRDVAWYVERCLTCRKVKAEHQRPHGKMQPLDIPVWKWEDITMDFVTKLPRTARGVDSIWVVVDRLTKSAHFIPIQESISAEKLADIYVREIVARHGVLVSVVSDRDVRFTSRFWKRFHDEMGTRLHFSTAFHPQTDGQCERTIQTLEDMLRACVLDFGGSWDTYLPLAEFSYNNSYHASID
uniref:Integrase catalytic domain-containing protein n=1 Tax=Lactuca sativa TaxID=4236 RepID=A0A9R1X7S0_LACSA|nr:hypothetical protein LSAT_V11C600310350 [Lactuca sativa]